MPSDVYPRGRVNFHQQMMPDCVAVNVSIKLRRPGAPFDEQSPVSRLLIFPSAVAHGGFGLAETKRYSPESRGARPAHGSLPRSSTVAVIFVVNKIFDQITQCINLLRNVFATRRSRPAAAVDGYILMLSACERTG